MVLPTEARGELKEGGHVDPIWSCVKGLQKREVSMSTSLLYHAFSIRGYEYVRTEYQGGNVVFTIQQAPKTFRCEACGSRDVRPRGRVERRFQSLPIGSRPTVVVLDT